MRGQKLGQPASNIKAALAGKFYGRFSFQVCKQCETGKHASGELWWSELSLALPLFAKHFSTGRLVLRCTAQVADMYQQHTEVVLYDESGPVPERGT